MKTCLSVMCTLLVSGRGNIRENYSINYLSQRLPLAQVVYAVVLADDSGI
jgi:hypothetical protein